MGQHGASAIAQRLHRMVVMMTARNGRWTAEIDALMLDLLDKGWSAAAIADRLSEGGFPTTRNSVIGRLFRLREMGNEIALSLARPKPEPKPKPVDLGPNGCRWPIGDPGQPDFRFCEAPAVVLGKPYCSPHCALAYRAKEEAPPRSGGFDQMQVVGRG